MMLFYLFCRRDDAIIPILSEGWCNHTYFLWIEWCNHNCFVEGRVHLYLLPILEEGWCNYKYFFFVKGMMQFYQFSRNNDAAIPILSIVLQLYQFCGRYAEMYFLLEGWCSYVHIFCPNDGAILPFLLEGGCNYIYYVRGDDAEI